MLRYDLGGSDPQRLEFMLDKRTVYASLANLLIEQDQDLDEAFEHLQRAKARTFLDMLYGSEVALHTGVDASLLEREQTLATQLANVRWELIHTGQTEDKSALKGQAQELEDELLRVRDHLRESNPKYHALFRGQTASLSQVQAQLDPDEVLLDFFVTEDRTFLFSISSTEAQVHRIPLMRTKLMEMVDDVHKIVASPPKTGIDARSFYLQFAQSSQELHQSLLKPAEGVTGEARHLIIAPHDTLYRVPFAALLASEPDEELSQNVSAPYHSLDYLVRHYSLSYVPSASVLWQLKHQATQRAAPTRRIALGLPELVLDSEPDAPPLATEEMAMLQQFSSIHVYTGRQATEARVKALSGENLDILHFAVHGIFDDTQPLRSYLQLGASPDEDGHLYVYEVLDMELKTRLVVLSACVTARRPLTPRESVVGSRRNFLAARRPVTPGEGMVGLTRVFLAAGAQSVLASHWNVDDVPTTSLLRKFYSALGQQTDDAKALRQAQLAVINTTPIESSQTLREQASAHPHYWAAFVLTGRTH